MTSTPPGPSNPGRIAGLWYLAITLLGPIRLLYIPAKLFVPNDAAATVTMSLPTNFSSVSAFWLTC